MNGFFQYFLGVLDPSSIFGFWRALPELMASAYIPWGLLGGLPVARWFLPDMVCWLVYLVKPAVMRPPLPVSALRAEPFVSVVIAGRNEAASIGEAIRAALLCGYSNIEVIFVDDCSDDDSIAVARRAVRNLVPRGTDRIRISARLAATARPARSISASAWRKVSSSLSSTRIQQSSMAPCIIGCCPLPIRASARLLPICGVQNNSIDRHSPAGNANTLFK